MTTVGTLFRISVFAAFLLPWACADTDAGKEAEPGLADRISELERELSAEREFETSLLDRISGLERHLPQK